MLLELARYEDSFARTLSLVKKDPALYFLESERDWAKGTRYRFGVWCQDIFAGLVGVREVDHSDMSGEIFYFVIGSFEGKGLAFEATQALVSHLSQQFGLSNLWLRVIPQNQRSVKLARRLGFEAAELMPRSYQSFDGRFHDTELYRL